MNWVQRNNKIVATFKPLYIDRELSYEVESKTSQDKPCEFKTATSNMRIVKFAHGLALEHLCVDGRMRYIKYKGKHLGDLNFHNIGWEGPQGRRYVRVDVYTGEHCIVED